MMRRLYTVFIFFTLTSLYSQTNSYKQTWEGLLRNERSKSLKDFDSKYKKQPKNLEKLLVKQILKGENGFLKTDDAFINSFLQQKDYEYYLYALWNDDLFFKNYLESGFNAGSRKTLMAVEKQEISNPTIKSSIKYLSSVLKRTNGDLEAYHKALSEISAIKSWQYCGVFENLNNSGLDIVYKPEELPFSKDGFNTNSNGVVNWYVPKIVDLNPYQIFSNHEEYGTGVHYGQTFLDVDKDKRVILSISSSSAFKVWLNDILILEDAKDIDRDLDAFNVEITIPKGKNRLLIKNAEGNGTSYFIVRVLDKKGNEVSGINDSNQYGKYNKSTKEQLNPINRLNSIEAYFLKKVKENPNNFLYTYCLVKTYLRNQKYDAAKKIILPYLDTYPKSSFLRRILINCYTYERDQTSIDKLKNNMLHDDEDYYLSLLYKFQDQKELARLDLDNLKKFLDKFSKAVDYDILKQSADLIYNMRISNKKEVKATLDEIMDSTSDWLFMKKTYAKLYTAVLNSDSKTIQLYEALDEKYFDYAVKVYLRNKYKKLNQIDKATEVYKDVYKGFNNETFSIKDLANHLINYKKYKEAISYIDKGLAQFPYSFRLMKMKGDALLQLNKKQEALKYYKQSLHHNRENSKLRKEIQDLLGKKDLVEQIHMKDAYKYIKDTRGKVKINNYGYNILLDDAIVLLYAEGDVKARYSFIYEITSDAGVERFKEHDLGLSGSYKIIKSEIVKENEETIPADKKGAKLVFQNLAVGDVINIDYEVEYSGSGRFYKDYIEYYQFDSFHPCMRTSYTILVPDNTEIKYKVVNGDLTLSKEKLEGYTKYNWTLDNHLGIPKEENYMPNTVDIVRYLHISTIPSWSKIANWYSDLVRHQKIYSTEVDKEFKKIFPNGFSTLSEDERARRIYDYIINNFTYSHVSFRQSGYTPQKPSKTINTKLGDCKDFSTLFNTLAEKAGLKSNLVLILTNDHGQNSIVLPSQDFNHCIIRVEIDGKKQFLELTDKYLPYKSLPVSLINATGLLIPNEVDKNGKYELFKLNNLTKQASYLEKNAVIKVNDTTQVIDVQTKVKGSASSYYFGVFDNNNYNVIKESIKDDFRNNLKGDFVIDTLYNISAKRGVDTLKYSAKISLKNKTKKIGSIHILQLPMLSTVYESSVINSNDRKFPIEYTQYENVEHYKKVYNIYLPKGKKFIEIPKSNEFRYKNHFYAMKFDLIANNHLKVTVNAKTDIENNISVKEYKDFKTYVESIITAKEAFIGYK